MISLPQSVLVALVFTCAAWSGDGFAGPMTGVASRVRRGVTLGEARATFAQASPSSLPLLPSWSVFASRRGSGLVMMSTEQERAEVKVEGTPAAEGEGGAALGDEKVIYDKRTGRFFEKKIEEVCREEYCAIDESTGEPMLLTTGEKERIFMDAIQSFYYNQRQVLTDEDFDRLKEDLAWEGSKVVLMNRDEQLFVNAMAAYARGEQIISDEEFDRLKSSLRDTGSMVAVSTEPKCYIDTGICTVTFQEDLLRRFATYLPANFIFGLAFLGISWEIITPLRYLNPLLVLLLLVYPTIVASKKFTDLCLYQNDGKIAYGPCPSCSAPNRVFFGNILGVEGERDDMEFKCSSCKEQIKLRQSDLRARTLPKF